MDHLNLPIVTSRIARVCEIAAPRSMLIDLNDQFRRSGLRKAVARHDTPVLFDWLIGVLSYQGVSDAIAWAYMDQHGTVTFADIDAVLSDQPSCPKLRSYWHFDDCRFAKQTFLCREPDHIEACPLPLHDLRNGRLNQTAYSLFLFLRDVCDGDLVGWIDAKLANAVHNTGAGHHAELVRQALLEPLSGIYGVSFKVLSMALADLLLAGDPGRRRWVKAGASMVAIDTLVHNWLHRTGCLRDLEAEHGYGAGCYAPGGCADIIEAASQSIDARRFCPEGPVVFPRLIQKAIWLFCTEAGHDICNGNRIDDRFACRSQDCPIREQCRCIPLRSR
ncbi:hypothetical protein LGH83_08675 [Lichenihabitans sp. PAMC28606]|uniref:hypothetical protein n=1 Tax=Lichenihabitans sp. PAMC28606 TaxID=2880932 RepID=UPI001D0A53AC|nr:hypothetical protein [Lichenihabitans sp. PAMC28606]UDL96234.1 hypothetical protein LGH83_08675 [Lichenihabitans sp. PAMC28606]